MDDILSMLGIEGELTREDRAAALGVSRDRGAGLLAQLSGDRVLSGVGGSLLGGAARREAQLAEAPGRRLAQALSRQQLTRGQQDLDYENSHVGPTELELAKMFGVQLPPETTRREAKQIMDWAQRAYGARQQAEDRRLNREAMRNQKQEAADAKQEKDLDKQIETLSKRTEAAPAIRNDLAELQSGPDEDIPGVGPIAGRLPLWMLSEEGKRKHQAARGLVGTIIKERSGTAASEKEIDRIMNETGLNMANEEQFRLGVERLRQQSVDVLKAKEAGARPEAVREARRRGLVTSEDLAGPSAPAQPMRPASGTVPMVNRKGQPFDVPEGQVRAAEGKGWKRVD